MAATVAQGDPASLHQLDGLYTKHIPAKHAAIEGALDLFAVLKWVNKTQRNQGFDLQLTNGQTTWAAQGALDVCVCTWHGAGKGALVAACCAALCLLQQRITLRAMKCDACVGITPPEGYALGLASFMGAVHDALCSPCPIHTYDFTARFPSGSAGSVLKVKWLLHGSGTVYVTKAVALTLQLMVTHNFTSNCKCAATDLVRMHSMPEIYTQLLICYTLASGDGVQIELQLTRVDDHLRKHVHMLKLMFNGYTTAMVRADLHVIPIFLISLKAVLGTWLGMSRYALIGYETTVFTMCA
jgi:hypothetical protein